MRLKDLLVLYQEASCLVVLLLVRLRASRAWFRYISTDDNLISSRCHISSQGQRYELGLILLNDT